MAVVFKSNSHHTQHKHKHTHQSFQRRCYSHRQWPWRTFTWIPWPLPLESRSLCFASFSASSPPFPSASYGASSLVASQSISTPPPSVFFSLTFHLDSLPISISWSQWQLVTLPCSFIALYVGSSPSSWDSVTLLAGMLFLNYHNVIDRLFFNYYCFCATISSMQGCNSIVLCF